MSALVPYLFPIGAIYALAVMAGTIRAYLPAIRATVEL